MATNDNTNTLAKFTRIYPQGAIIFQENDPGDCMYFILDGAVSIVRNYDRQEEHKHDSGGQVTLATLRQGDFFGEMSVFTGLPRSGTAVTVARTVLLVLRRREIEEVIRARPELAMQLIETLCRRLQNADASLVRDRARSCGGADDRAAVAVAPKKRWDDQALPDLPEPSPAAAAPAAPARTGNYRSVSTTCPICSFAFKVPWVSSRAFQVGKRDSDLRPHYEKENGLYYSIWVCPRCRFAAYRDKFDEITGEQVALLRRSLDPGAAVDAAAVQAAAAPPDLQRAIYSYRLAIAAYQMRRSPAVLMAGLYHQLAWLYREAGDEEKEKQCLRLTIEKYIEAYQRGRGKLPSNLGEPGVLYLIGELNRRLGEHREAARYLENVIRHPDIRKYPLISDLARERWMEMKEASRGTEVAPGSQPVS